MESGNEASAYSDDVNSTSPKDGVIMTSLGLYSCMAETDNNRYSGSQRVNMKIWGGVPSFYQNLSTYQVSYLLVLQLLSYVS